MVLVSPEKFISAVQEALDTGVNGDEFYVSDIRYCQLLYTSHNKGEDDEYSVALMARSTIGEVKKTMTQNFKDLLLAQAENAGNSDDSFILSDQPVWAGIKFKWVVFAVYTPPDYASDASSG